MSDDFRLEFYWYKAQDDERVGDRWGQLAGSLHRLVAVSEELEILASSDDALEIASGINRLAYHVENYFNRVYELRDRAFGLLSVITGNKNTVDKLRHSEQRAAATAVLQQVAPGPMASMSTLLDLLQEDIGLRNTHTHETYLRLGLYTGDDVYDPEDVLVDLHRNKDATARISALLRREMKRTANNYTGKISQVIAVTQSLLDQVRPEVARAD